MGDGPVVYEELMGARVEEIVDEAERRFEAEMFHRSRALVEWNRDWLDEQLRRAYVAGVSDGFTQGVARVADGRVDVPAPREGGDGA